MCARPWETQLNLSISFLSASFVTSCSLTSSPTRCEGEGRGTSKCKWIFKILALATLYLVPLMPDVAIICISGSEGALKKPGYKVQRKVKPWVIVTAWETETVSCPFWLLQEVWSCANTGMLSVLSWTPEVSSASLHNEPWAALQGEGKWILSWTRNHRITVELKMFWPMLPKNFLENCDSFYENCRNLSEKYDLLTSRRKCCHLQGGHRTNVCQKKKKKRWGMGRAGRGSGKPQERLKHARYWISKPNVTYVLLSHSANANHLWLASVWNMGLSVKFLSFLHLIV